MRKSMFKIGQNGSAMVDCAAVITGMIRACCSFLLIGLVLAGCATLPTEYPRHPSTAITDYPATGLDQLFEEVAAQHPGESGFAIIRHGRQAFTARVALTELAEKSLDLQYYIWEADATGRILAERLVRAADRGVRVRVLLDDINMEGDAPIAALLDTHPNIEIRIFNPFANRGFRLFDFALDLDRVNHRMHNKILVADNAVTIVGGRNIGNHYFEVATEANFRDLDIAAGGPVVRDVSNVFDHFWNSDWAVPVSALVERSYTESELQAAMRSFRERVAADRYPYPLDQDVAALRADLTSIRDHFIWAPGQIVWDDPNDITTGAEHGRISMALYRKLDTLQKELLIESAYFVARERGIEKAKQLNDRGIRMRLLTNSLATNDVLAAHAGHAKYREALLANGVELYELRPDAGAIKKKVLSGQSKAALHTKAIVFDRESVFIGSFNLDPRSANLNTEAGLYVESPELAAQVIDYMNEGVRPENSYRVMLDEDGHLVWVTQVNGMEVRFYQDPETGFWDRFMSGFIGLLPVESQL
jgi:putative cardiolipin synthase